jgi:hypothetical protein
MHSNIECGIRVQAQTQTQNTNLTQTLLRCQKHVTPPMPVHDDHHVSMMIICRAGS